VERVLCVLQRDIYYVLRITLKTTFYSQLLVARMRKRKQTQEEIELAEAIRKTIEKDHEIAVAGNNVVVNQFKKETLRFEE